MFFCEDAYAKGMRVSEILVQELQSQHGILEPGAPPPPPPPPPPVFIAVNASQNLKQRLGALKSKLGAGKDDPLSKFVVGDVFFSFLFFLLYYYFFFLRTNLHLFQGNYYFFNVCVRVR